MSELKKTLVNDYVMLCVVLKLHVHVGLFSVPEKGKYISHELVRSGYTWYRDATQTWWFYKYTGSFDFFVRSAIKN